MKISLLADHPSESKKIAKWYYDEWGRLSSHITEELMFQKVMEKSLNRNQMPLSLIAHDDEVLVGVIELKKHENKSYMEYENWVGGVYTCPKHRRNGIAGFLLEAIKSKAIEMDINKLYLQCESFNVSLYLKHGFNVLHKADYHGVETSIMIWEADSQ